MSARPAGFLGRWVFSTDHKVIGLQYLFTSLVLLAIGGLFALALRWQLAWPWSVVPGLASLFPESGGAMTPEFFTMLFTMHGTVMIFFVVIPMLTGAFGNFLIPLMIGARDMAFPRLNMLSYWAMVPAILCLVAGFHVAGGAASAGWTGYAPLSTLASLDGQTWWLLAISFTGLSSILGAINYVTTVISMRASGLSLLRLPLTIWSLFIAAVLQLLALPVLTAGGLMALSDRLLHTGFFTPANLWVGGVSPEAAGHAVGGEPLLWQHLFWFYGHPAVYVVILPAMGMISDLIAVHARKPVFGYKPMVASMLAIAGLGFVVWGHHMFTAGMDPTVELAFALSTTLIALPSAVKTFNWLATLWGSRMRFTTPMLWCLGFVSMFIVGGLSGIWLAATAVDVYLHDTTIVVAHFHYIVFGGSVFAIFGAIHHWFPKMFGRHMSERLGRVHFIGTFVFAHGTFFLMHQLGLAGLIRRSADPYAYGVYAHLQPTNQIVTLCAIGLFAWQVFFVVNFFWSLFRGARAERNPWQATTLEWETASPPVHGNFERELSVERGPYEYGELGASEDFLPQARTLSPRP